MKRLIARILISAIYFISFSVIFVGGQYLMMHMMMYFSSSLGGMYNPIGDYYICEDQAACYHEQGHSYDANGAPFTFIESQWRSTDKEYRANIDIIAECMLDFYENNNDSQKRNLSDSKVLSAISWSMQTDMYKDDQRYLEAYARTYAIMKEYKWDTLDYYNGEEYKYNNVENIVAQKANYCKTIQIEIAAQQ